MSLKERLMVTVENCLKEELDSSKEMIQSNTVPSFSDMGMANVKPGEFAQDEITDQENLVNKGVMSNDTDFDNKADNPGSEDTSVDMSSEEVNISADDDSEGTSLEIVKTVNKDCENPLAKLFGESKFSKIVQNTLNGKSCREILSEAGDYAGPLDYVPDTRINVSDVIKTLKDKIGDGSEAIHVDQVYDEQKNNAYKVSQIDKEKLPKKIQVQNVLLELDGDTYKVNKVSTSFPLAR